VWKCPFETKKRLCFILIRLFITTLYWSAFDYYNEIPDTGYLRKKKRYLAHSFGSSGASYLNWFHSGEGSMAYG
jgi:hypothetical protein